MSIVDFMQPVDKPNFGAAWEALKDGVCTEETYDLPLESLDVAVEKIIEVTGMQPCEKSGTVKSGKNTHQMFLAGVYIGGDEVLVRARLTYDSSVTLNLAVRSADEGTCELISGVIG